MPALPRLALAAALALAAPAALAQEGPNLMIVFDGSGSMWGQVGGRAKIELARQALSSVLSEVSPGMEIGMLAYGHRVRGQCADIELMVPMGPAGQTVPGILDAASRMNPRGMTPLTDAVLIAAQRMGYTEQAATVVLLTDGIETCGGDPCALGRLLAAEGIDFRAHVVGFDLTDAEQRQVSCLADETGGLFLAASSADELQSALARTLAVDPAPQPEPEPASLPRQVDLILRDVEGGPVLTGRPFRAIEFQPLDEGAPPPGRLDLNANPGSRTGVIDLAPGRYRMLALRATEGGNIIRMALPVEIPEGTGPHTLDLIIAARLRINAFLHEGQPMPEGNGRIARLTGQGWAEFAIHPVIGGAIDPAVDYGGINSRDVALPPGDYFLRGTLTQTFTLERLISVAPGVTTTVDFDFGAAPVSVDLRDPQGFPVDRVRVEIYDLDAADPFVSGRGRQGNEVVPAYLPAGTWRITARGDRGGAPVAEGTVTVAPGQPATLSLVTGAAAPGAIPAEDAMPRCIDTHSSHGCVVAAVSPADIPRHLGLSGPEAARHSAARYAGTWQTQGGMMVLAQDGRRVWGEVHVNGGVGLVWGHVAPDGLTLRGAMDRSSSPRGAVEMRLDTTGDRLFGYWDHNIGRAGSTLQARRLSGANPPMTRATGAEDDLRVTMTGSAWAPADSPEFAAFMVPVMEPASPDTGEDIDAMQAAAPPADFTGRWSTNHQELTLHQEGRRVWGRRMAGSIWGEVSADGQTLRGVWNNGRDWGLLEFRLDPERRSLEGTWGRMRDGLPASHWSGARRAWLVDPVDPVSPPAEAQGDAWEAFMAPVRDPDPIPDRAEVAPAHSPGGGVAIGAIDALPESGIFATMADRPGEPLAEAFARLFDGAEDARMAQACAQQPWVLHPDGLMAERALDVIAAQAGGAAYRTLRYQRCEQAGPLAFCRVFLEPLRQIEGEPSFDYRAEVIAGPDGSFALRDADAGRAMLYRECRGARGFMGELDRWPDGRLIQDTMRQREDQDHAALAPPQTPGPSPLPPGLWHAQAPWSDPMPARGTAAFADRCYDAVSATWPDGQTIGLDWQQGATGPEYQATWAEVCSPSGDPDWPFLCRSEDANPSDGAATATSRMRVVSATAERVDLILDTEYDPEPAPFVLHACHLPGGIDLTGDPRGRALAHALAQIRPGLALPVAGTSAPAPVDGPKPAGAGTGTAPLTALAGVWYPIRDGRRPALLTDDEVAAVCFDDPVRIHPDGLVMMFRSEGRLPQADSHMRCGADLSCTYAPGTPSAGRPVQGQARLTPVTEGEIDACLGAQCVTLGRCPAPDWSVRERASGLASRWEDAIATRD